MEKLTIEQVYRMYFSDVYRYVLNLSGSRIMAENITGETFLKAMASLDKFRGECSLRVWLCQIAKNSYYHAVQKKENRHEPLEEQELPDPRDLEEAFLESETAGQLHRYLHDLQEPYREVFHLRTFCELSFRQIGQLFGKSENWACVTYHRAKAKILEQWRRDNEDSL